MTNLVTGQVFRVYDKQFPGKPLTHSFKLDGDPLYYRVGTNRFPGILESGNVVEFTATQNPDGKSANVTSPVKAGKAVAAPVAASGTPTMSYDARNNSIAYQSSRKDAIALVDIILREKAYKLPTKIADQLGAITDLVDHLTASYFEDVGTLGAVTRANETEGETATTTTEDEE